MGKCFLRCKTGYDIVGFNYTTCQNNGKWGSFPTCRKVSCPEPDLSSSFLKANGKCSGKFYQDECFVTCREGGQLIGDAKIKCEYTGVWSSLPHCTCPAPNPPDDLVLNNCNSKRPDEHCFVECKKHLKLFGDAFLLCQKNTKWGILPKCMPKICPPPNIPEYLEVKDNCSSKKIAEYCEVSCKHGGKVIGTSSGRNTLRCLASLNWSSLPDCTCAIPIVLEPIQLITICDSVPKKGKCFLRCKTGYDIAGFNYTTCQNNGKWGSFPTCRKVSCPEPDLSSSFLKANGKCSGKFYQDECFVTCREGGQLIGDAKIKCEYTGVWSSLPHCTCRAPNPPDDLVLNNCNSKRPDEHCFVECKKHLKLFGDAFLLCQKNTKWGILPKCMPKICPPPNIPEYLEVKDNCSSKKIAEYCEVSCKHGGKVIGTSSGRNTLRCLESLNWSSLPDCTCANPIVFEPIQLITICDSIPKKGKCFLRCKTGYDIAGFNYTTCQNNGKWGSFPTCRKVSCPEPDLSSSFLKANGKCSGKFYQDECFVTCREGGQLIGDAKIKCEYTGVWSSLPHCTCRAPNPPDDLVLNNCNSKRPDEHCFVECKKHLKLFGDAFFCVKKYEMGHPAQICKHGGKVIGTSSGRNTLRCLESLNWSSLPDCTCANPIVFEPIQLITICDSIPKKGKCFLRCKTGYDIAGFNYTTCQNNGKWGSFPTCRKVSCPEPDLSSSFLKANGKCSGKFYQDECFVTCREGGQLIGDAKIKCEYTGVWSSLPHCTCPAPNPSDDLVLNNCNSKRPDEHCFVECKKHLKLFGDAFLLCQKNTKWGILPKSEYCEVSCKHGGKVIGTSSGRNTLRCLESLNWSSLPDCTCANPIVFEPIQLITICDSIPKKGKCFLRCKTGYDIAGFNYTTCQNNGKWGSFPTCRKVSCPDPDLSSSFLKANGKCSGKFYQDECFVTCREGGQLIGDAKIKCEYTGVWSSLPHCTCRAPNPPDDLVLNNCNSKRPDEHCFVECKKHLKLFGDAFLLCQKNTKWGILPKSEYCEVSCKHGGKVIGTSSGRNTLRCLESLNWSSLPDCTCANPIVFEPIQLITICDSIPKKGKCFLRCKTGYDIAGFNYTTCQNNGKWGSFPTCRKVSCPEPDLSSSFLKANGKCSGKFYQDECFVTCREGGQLIGDAKIKCEYTGVWSSLPHCTCPAPNPSDDLVLNNCNSKRPDEHCFVECKMHLKLFGDAFLLCQKNTKWGILPKCMPKICPPPNIPEYLEVKDNCSSKKIAEYCEVSCKHGGKVIGTSSGRNTLRCLESLNWSSLPDCTCANPIVFEPIQLITICDSIPKKESAFSVVKLATISQGLTTLHVRIMENGDRFLPAEKEGGQLIGDAKIKCEYTGVWSSLPHCTCRAPNPPDDLVLNNCNSKRPDEHCFVECKKQLKLFGDAFLLCQKNTKWGILPKCIPKICPPPNVPDYLEVKGNCSSKKIAEHCEISCKHGGKVIGTLNGEKRLICLENLKWSSPPDCTCPLPNVPDQFQNIGNCSFKLVNENCEIKCKSRNYTDILTCSENRDWTTLPYCGLDTCDVPLLPVYLSGKCVSKNVGARCMLDCRSGGNIIGNDYIQCLEGRIWSILPDCTCPVPNLDKGYICISNCRMIKAFDVCSIKCVFQRSKVFNITCQINRKWSSPEICPSSSLSAKESGIRQSNIYITSTPGHMYRQDYKEPGSVSCSTPLLPVYISGKCTQKNVRARCILECRSGGKILPNDYIECLEGGIWSTLPDCTCPFPSLDKGYIYTSNCHMRYPSDVCSIKCVFQRAKVFNITCQINRKWSFLEICPRSYLSARGSVIRQGNIYMTSTQGPDTCSTPLLPVYLSGKCTQKNVGARCILDCRSGGKMVQWYNYIQCLQEGIWSRFPDCSCPVPYFDENYEPDPNCRMKEFDVCSVRCKYLRLKVFNVTCQKNRMWSVPEKCGHYLGAKTPIIRQGTINIPDYREPGPDTCSLPLLPFYLKFADNCRHKKVGEQCMLECRRGGSLIRDLTCLRGGIWSRFQSCTCPHPNLPDDIETIGNCSSILINEDCNIKCKYRNYNEKLFCRSNAEWAPLPPCGVDICDVPSFPVYLYRKCFPKRTLKVGERCFLTCSTKGNMIGNDYIQCLEGRIWSTLPDCTCPVPFFDDENYEPDPNCKLKEFDVCSVRCKYLKSRVFNVTCQKNRMWSVPERCGPYLGA
ncbi:sushi, von Willebrand factor type A, EGF and pentraxin domain-containing protein 1 [Trichonephila clavipes]|nr:sushi, von Willebrand factor type A, EGF and pentraxin domain-containing protein 1 [Trichonephila clavipes]